MKSNSVNLTDRCKSFVKQYNDIKNQLFTKDMLKQLADLGFLGWMIPSSSGGQGKTAQDIVQAGETLMIHCENLGIVLSWVIHEIVTTWFINGFGSDQQKQLYLPALIKGDLLGSVAISEPDVGPHPKFLKTYARSDHQNIVLNGEKTFLTNGPIADIYVVIAISKVRENRKFYSAYIIHENNQGLTRTKPLPIPFVQTSPHGGIIMNDCLMSNDQLLGESNTAYEKMVKPFREIEDILMMGPILGGLCCQINRSVQYINTSSITLDKEQLILLGNLKSHIITLRVIAHKASQLLDEHNHSTEMVALLVAFRQWAANFQHYHAQLCDQLSIVDNHLSHLSNDLCGIGKVALKIMLNKQMNIGKNILVNHVVPSPKV
jgi:acyl-CoA dehydrogenase